MLVARPLEEKLHRAIATVKRQGSGRTPRLLRQYSALFRKFLEAFLSVCAVSLVAQLACLPGQLLIRPGINTLTVLANVAIAPVVTLLNTGDRLHLGDDSGSGGRLQSIRNLAMASRRGRDFGIGDSGGGADLYLPLLLSKKEDKWQC